MNFNSENPDVHISDFRAYGILNTSMLTINSSAGPGGSITPQGIVDVTSGANQTFTITPSAGYAISSVLVDGVSQGALTSYTFTGVTVNHTISATFASLENIALNKPATSQSELGAGVASRANDADGSNASFWNGIGHPQWWEVDLGARYDLTSIVVRNWVDGTRYYQYTVEASIDGLTYSPVAAKTSIVPATDAGDSYAVTVTARYLRVNMNFNSENPDVHISDFRAYGILNTSVLTINSSAGTGGSIAPQGIVEVTSGANQTFTIAPVVGYAISSVLVDGVSQGALTSYTFTGVTVNHTISATFTSLENVALNKPATSQSALGAGVASMANDADGSNASYWNGIGQPQWWEVDLGGNYVLSSIVVRNWVDGARYYLYTVEASTDGLTYTQIAAKTSTEPATDAGDVYAVSVTARYLKVNVEYNSENADVHISDFRAYGIAQAGAMAAPAAFVTGAKGSGLSENASMNPEIKTELGTLKLNVYPNPFIDRLTVRIDSPMEEMFDVTVISLGGGTVHLRTEIPANTDNIFNLQLSRGIYILRVNNKERTMTQRIIKN
jgi:hypothetical protein